MRGNSIVVAAIFYSVVLAGGLLAKKSSRHNQETEGPAARLSEAPESARALKNPFEGDKRAEAAGRKLFRRHCAECHGRDGLGIGKAADLHSAEFQSAPPGTLFWSIRNGRLAEGMPAWSSLPDQQIWQVVTYLKTLH
jgi:mono/diheme cytochrome c family protein